MENGSRIRDWKVDGLRVKGLRVMGVGCMVSVCRCVYTCVCAVCEGLSVVCEWRNIHVCTPYVGVSMFMSVVFVSSSFSLPHLFLQLWIYCGVKAGKTNIKCEETGTWRRHYSS